MPTYYKWGGPAVTTRDVLDADATLINRRLIAAEKTLQRHRVESVRVSGELARVKLDVKHLTKRANLMLEGAYRIYAGLKYDSINMRERETNRSDFMKCAVKYLELFVGEDDNSDLNPYTHSGEGPT
jgi:hypothetical protein